MRRHFLSRLSAAVLFLLAASSTVRALEPVTAGEAPRADAKLLRALAKGAAEVRIIVGVQDGTPSARALRERPDPAGEPARRIRRIEAQKRLVEAVPDAVIRQRPDQIRAGLSGWRRLVGLAPSA